MHACMYLQECRHIYSHNVSALALTAQTKNSKQQSLESMAAELRLFLLGTLLWAPKASLIQLLWGQQGTTSNDPEQRPGVECNQQEQVVEGVVQQGQAVVGSQHRAESLIQSLSLQPHKMAELHTLSSAHRSTLRCAVRIDCFQPQA